MVRFNRALTREMVAMSASAFVALAAIFVVVVLVRVLGKAAVGDLEATAVLPMLAFGVLRFMPVLLSLALFIGVFMSLSRIWRDSEAIIWMCGGVGPMGWAWPVLQFALPMVLLIAFVSFVALPWAAKKQTDYEHILEARDEVSTLAPGMFTEFAQGKRVHFVESVSPDGQHVGNVFVQSQVHGRTAVMVAREGHVATLDKGNRFLVLDAGRRYEGLPGDADFRVGEFASYAVRIQPQALEQTAISARMLSVAALWAQPTPVNMGEWVWRVGYPLSALLLALLAVPLSYVNPRAGRSMNVVFAILIYVAYNNFVGLSEGWVTRMRLSAASALLLVHGGMLLLLLSFYWQRFRGPWAR
jgi:lipopolysaccharide export system permease protein